MANIAIGIPVFNEGRYISKTLLSAILQFNSYKDLEIVISDNGSTDNTLIEIYKAIEIANCDNRIKVITHQQNTGAFKNFWEVFDSTDSKYFMWLGGHDLLSDKFISNGVDFLSSNSEYSFFSGAHLSINEESKVENKPIVYEFNNDNKFERYLLSIQKLSNCYIFHSIFDRKFMADYGRYNCPSEDHIMISRLLWFGKLYQSNDCAYVRRYFTAENRLNKQKTGSYVTRSNNIEFYESYLSDLDSLTINLSKNIKTAIINKASEVLIKRLGLPFIK